jgi:hypothetical protein
MSTDSISILKDLWFSPRKVFEYVNHKNWSSTLPLAILGSFSILLNYYTTIYSTHASLILSIVLGFFGWIVIYLFSYITKLVTQMYGAHTDTFSIFAVRSYAMIPMIIGIPALLIEAIVDREGPLSTFLTILLLILMILSYVYYIIGISVITKSTFIKAYLIHITSFTFFLSIPAVLVGIFYVLFEYVF